MLILKSFLFLCSILGYVIWIRKKLKVEYFFIPIFLFTCIGLLTYFGGLFYRFDQIPYFIYGIGLLLFGFYGYRWRKYGDLKVDIRLFPCVFFGISIIFLVSSLQFRLQHYDNFSHWAVITKYLLTNHTLPTIDDAIISFKEYPLGTTSFIYYVCFFLGKKEGMMLFAQNLLVLSCFYAMFGIIREKRRFFLYSFLAMGGTCLSYLNLTIRINNLLVDFVLPLLTLTMFSIIYRYGNEKKTMAILLVPILGFTMIVKSTGVIFAMIGIAYFIWDFIRKKENWKWKYCFLIIGVIGISLMPKFSWDYHLKTNLVGLENKFALETENKEHMPVEKEQYPEVITTYLNTIFDKNSRATQSFFFFQIVAIVGYCYGKYYWKKRWNLGKVLVLMDLVVVLYYIGILGLYLFSMPADEALRVAGMERYACSIIVLFVGTLFLCSTIDIERSFYIQLGEEGEGYQAFYSPQTKKNYQRAVLVTLAIGLNFLYSEICGLWAIQKEYGNSLAGRIVEITGDQWLEEGEQNKNRYYVVASNKNGEVENYGVSYTTKYFLFAENVTVVDKVSEKDIEKVSQEYDYLVILNPECVIKEENTSHLEQVNEKGIYAVKEFH